MPSLHRNVFALISLLAVWSSPSPSAAHGLSRDCKNWITEHAAMDLEYSDELLTVPCHEAATAVIEQIQQKLDARRMALSQEPNAVDVEAVDGRPRFSELDAETLAQYQDNLSRLRDLVAAKASLDAGLLAEARWHLQRLQASRADLTSADEDLWDIYDLDAVLAIIHQPPVRPEMISLRVPAPEAEWIVYEQRCHVGEENEIARFPAPELADAWLALGHRDEAMRTFLQTHWVNAAADLQLPWRLRLLAEEIYGVEGANAGFEAGLASIRIDTHVSGRAATMNLFGVWLPLPVASVSRVSEFEPTTEHTSTLMLKTTRHDYTASELALSLKEAWRNSDHLRQSTQALEPAASFPIRQ